MHSRFPLLCLLAAGCASFDGDNAPTTAQRPTISSDTATAGEGTFELETGVAIDPGDTLDTPTVLKWGAGPATEFFAGWSPYQEQSQPGPDANGIADLLVGARHRFLEEGDYLPSAAFELATNLPTGDRSQGLSSGEIDFHAAVMLTKNVGAMTGTVYYDAGILGNPAGGTDLEHTLALAGGVALSQRIGVFAELAAVRNHTSHIKDYFATAGASYAVSRSLVFDVGATVGIHGKVPDFQILFGFTSNLGKPSSWLTR